MVKLKGPMSSAEASGSLGQAATFSSWKGRAYARAKVVPANPKTDLQQSVRAMLGFLSQQWAALSAAAKATWDVQALFAQTAPYSAYLSANLSRWREFHAPACVSPATEGGTGPSASALTVVGGTLHVDISATWSNVHDGWGMLMFHVPTALAPGDRTNLFAIAPIVTGKPSIGTYRTTVLGTHYFRIQTFTTTGKLGGQSVVKTATVT